MDPFIGMYQCQPGIFWNGGTGQAEKYQTDNKPNNGRKKML